MDRYLEVAYSATPPSAPPASSGYPTNGNPGASVPATEPGEWWFHMVTEELRNVIAAAGIAPNHAAVNQLALAIQQLIISGGAVKVPVRLSTTANIAALAGGAPNTLDGVALSVSDRVLVKNQATGSENGIYVVTTLGTGANGTWTRATDADGVGEMTSGMLVAVSEGNTYPDTVWELATNGTITIGTTALTFQWAGGLIGLTQTQFDNSPKLATTAFVKMAGAQYSQVISLNATSAISNTAAGSLVDYYGTTAGQTLTLPLLSSIRIGDSMAVLNTATVPVTLTRGGTDIFSYGSTILTSMIIQPGEFVCLTQNNSVWLVGMHTVSALSFGSSLATSGYQKLPSGLIIQWGTNTVTSGTPLAVTLPIAFPNAIHTVHAGMNTPAGAGNTCYVSPFSTTSITLNANGTAGTNSIGWTAYGR